MGVNKLEYSVSNKSKARKVVKHLRDGCWLVGFSQREMTIFGYAPTGVSDEAFIARIEKEYQEA